MRQFCLMRALSLLGRQRPPIAQYKEEQNRPSEQQSYWRQPRQQAKALPGRRPNNLFSVARLKIGNHFLLRFTGLQLLANNAAHLLRNRRRRISDRLALA